MNENVESFKNYEMLVKNQIDTLGLNMQHLKLRIYSMDFTANQTQQKKGPVNLKIENRNDLN